MKDTYRLLRDISEFNINNTNLTTYSYGRYIMLVLCLYFFTFQVPLEGICTVCGYIDEVVCFVFGIIAIFYTFFYSKISKKVLGVFFLFMIIVFIGFFSSFKFHFQPLGVAVVDALSFSRFFIILVSSIVLFKGFDITKYRKRLLKHLKLICIILFCSELFDIVFYIWPYPYLRYGLKVHMLYFTHPGRLAMVGCFLLLFLEFVSEQSSRKLVYQIGLVMLIALTFRAMGAVSIALYYILKWYIHKYGRIKLGFFLVFFPITTIVASKQIIWYYIGNTVSSRALLFAKGFQIARDFFPMGSGFGTYGSHVSATSYSPLYGLYGLSDIWGLSKDMSMDITDSFWGSLLGQFGFVGTFFFGIFLLAVWKMIDLVYSAGEKYYLICVFVFFYCCCAAFAGASFCHPGIVPLMMLMGISIGIAKRKRENNDIYIRNNNI